MEMPMRPAPAFLRAAAALLLAVPAAAQTSTPPADTRLERLKT
jgi:hypothetical protein